MLALIGAQRTGKSTLARAVADATHMTLVETKTSQVFSSLGLNPKADYPFETRMMIQQAILDSAIEQYRAGGRMFVTDRSPLDMLAYTMADVQRQNVTGAVMDELMKYRQRCFDVTNQFFGVLTVVQPGIPLVEEEGKAPANIAYMEHINSLVIGLAADEQIKAYRNFIGRDVLDLGERVLAVMGALSAASRKKVPAAEGIARH